MGDFNQHSIESRNAQTKTQRNSDDPEELLFSSASVNLRKVWEAVRKEAGTPTVRFHDLTKKVNDKMRNILNKRAAM